DFFRVFFFSSRRRHTRFKCDWSSDVCSSDLRACQCAASGRWRARGDGRPEGARGRADFEGGLMNAPATGSDDLIYAVDDGIAKITFNRPQARNAMTFAMYDQMASICEAINADRSIKALILTGAGDKAFARS